MDTIQAMDFADFIPAGLLRALGSYSNVGPDGMHFGMNEYGTPVYGEDDYGVNGGGIEINKFGRPRLPRVDSDDEDD